MPALSTSLSPLPKPGTHHGERNLKMTPHLATVVSADIAGYSRLMELDASGSIRKLQALRRDVIEPVSKDCAASLVRYAGDSILAEFPRASVAVVYAVQVQRELRRIEEDVLDERRIQLRIGIDSGYVFNVDGDLHGTSVNIAARLQALAAPGDIYLSEAALDQARSELLFRSEQLGRKHLKNITEPIQVFRILSDKVFRTERDPSIPTMS
jgi:class 3 adenylate cyclase